MKNPMFKLIAILIILIANTLNTMAQKEDKTLSPYFTIVSPHSSTEQLPLQASTAEVNIVGVIADVTIKQVYQNNGDSPIEAIYVFPASTKAAVYAMEMSVGGRFIKAKVKEKGEARKDYNRAKQQGKRASLLEQDRPNIFTMNVANILPGDEIEISLKYTETITPEEGIYTFVYPTVVGPRYTGEQYIAPEDRKKVLYTTELEAPHYEFDIAVNLSAGMPIQDVSCKTHKVLTRNNGLEQAHIQLDPSEKTGGNRDFILKYQLAGKKINSGLLLYEGKDENHFMLTVQPPKKVEDKDIPQREYIFVVDVSGSMGGFPLTVSKKLMRNLLSNLRPDDKFNLLFFAGTAKMYSEGESVYATAEEVDRAFKAMDNQQGSGSTELLDALNKAVNIPKCELGLSRSIVIITDGYISVESEVFDLIRNGNKEFNFYSFGIGSSINRHLVEGIAHVGNSEPLFVIDQEESSEKADKFRQRIAAPVMTDIRIDWGNMQVYDLEPSTVSDVLAERPLVITGKYKGTPNGEIIVNGVSGRDNYRAIYNASDATPSSNNQGLRYLWARNKIRMMDDYFGIVRDAAMVEKNTKEITALGIKYNLLTRFTSFIAVDESPAIAYKPNAKPKAVHKVNQPLPLPKGVPNSAVGTINTSQEVVSGYGADLTISNSLTGALSTISYEVEAANLTKAEDKFLEMEIGKKLKALVLAKGENSIKELAIQIEIDAKGKVTKVVLNNSKLSTELSDEIKKLIMNWQFVFRKNISTQIKLTIA